MNPIARRDDLVVERLSGETVVFDERTNKAHYLNLVSSEVWQRCDGQTDVATIAAEVRASLGVPCNEAAVALALEQLAKRGLLADEFSLATPAERISRRETLKRLAMAMAVPFVITVVAKKASAMVSAIAADDGGDAGDSGDDGEDAGDGGGEVDTADNPSDDGADAPPADGADSA